MQDKPFVSIAIRRSLILADFTCIFDFVSFPGWFGVLNDQPKQPIPIDTPKVSPTLLNLPEKWKCINRNKGNRLALC